MNSTRSRRLVLIRRDNVEHLIMIGGPQDVVVESGITASGIAASYAPGPAAVVDATVHRPSGQRRGPPCSATASRRHCAPSTRSCRRRAARDRTRLSHC